jgi:3-(3-hydroxy-phenyl)propionate hydroxylase
LDTLLGEGFAVIGWDSPAFRALAHTLVPAGAPYRVIALIKRDDDFLPEPAPDPPTRARDFTGILGELMDRDGAVALVVRPDRYVYRAVVADPPGPADAIVSAHPIEADLPIESAA